MRLNLQRPAHTTGLPNTKPGPALCTVIQRLFPISDFDIYDLKSILTGMNEPQMDTDNEAKKPDFTVIENSNSRATEKSGF